MAESSAVLVTRPEPDNARTAEALRARGHGVLLAPVLRLDMTPIALADAGDPPALVVTSSNALRAVAGSPARAALKKIPLFVVGEHTGAFAREMGFADVRVADGDVGALVRMLAAQAPKGELLYIAGDETTRDLAAEMAKHAVPVRTLTAYRMIPAARLPAEVSRAIGTGGIAAVLHYSRRSAHVFADLVRHTPKALAAPQCCLSPAIAEVLRAAGAVHVVSAKRPREQDLLEMLDRTLAQAQN